MPHIIQISLILSILCGDPPKFYKSNCPFFFHSHKPNTKKHNQKKKKIEIYHRNQFISLLRVRDSHWDYGQQPFHQSFRKVSSNYKALWYSFGFTYYDLDMDTSSSVQGHSFSPMHFIYLFIFFKSFKRTRRFWLLLII